MKDARRGFSDSWLQDVMRGRPIHLDAGGLLYVCAHRHLQAYLAGNYLPAVTEFQQQLLLFEVVYKWIITVVFDGCPPIEKQHEHDRRRQDPTSIVITSEYIAMCIRVCKNRCMNFVVAPAEADMQVGRLSENAVVLCRDSDEIAYGNKLVVLIDHYAKEEYRVIDMELSLTEDVEEKYPLYYYYRFFGLRVLHYWAACMGCDISPSKAGLAGIGREAFFKALQGFDVMDDKQFTSKSFAEELRKNGRLVTRTTYSVRAIQNELERVSTWFSDGGTYYNLEGEVISVSGRLVKEASRTTLRHMKGDIDPKTCANFTTEQRAKIDSVRSHNMKHNSSADRSKINGLSLPEGKTLEECTVDELKRMIIQRGGSLTGEGKALTKQKMQLIVKAYLLKEKENSRHTQYYDRSTTNNGVFAKINTGEKRTIGQIISSLQHPENAVMRFFGDVKRHFDNGCFEDDFTTIALSAPELKEDFIRKAFAHIGESTTQKNIADGCRQVIQMDGVIYHAVATAEDGKSIYILSKQRASQTHDESTRNKTTHGERPKFAEYLVMMQVAVAETTYSTHGHDLGICTHVMRAYCGQCTAGCGMCKHKSSALWMQHCHWGEGRPTEQPATSKLCSWVPGGRGARVCTTLLPACNTHMERLPGSNEEAQQKLDRGTKKNVHAGIPARYDVFNGDKRLHAMLNDPNFVAPGRLAKLFALIRKSNKNNNSDDDDE